MIIAIGLDLAEIDRFTTSLERGGATFRDKLFTAGELSLAAGMGRSTEFLAGRFAAKEAVMKCLGTGWSQGVAWRDIQVMRADSGAPLLTLTGVAATRAEELGITDWHLSITHTGRTAAAVALATGRP